MKHLSLLRLLALSATLTVPATGYSQTSISIVGRQYGSSNNASGPVAINVPTGTQNGDLMLAYIATQSVDGAWLTTPAGWTQARKTFNAIQGSQLFWRIANNEPASYTWSGASYPEGIIRTYRNVDTTTPIGSSAGCGSQSATSCQIPSFTETAVAGEWYVGFWDFNLGSAQIIGPSDLRNISNDQVQRAMFSGDKVLSASGNTTIAAETAAVTGAANYWDAIGVTLRPAASSSASLVTSSASPVTSSASSSTGSTASNTGTGVAAVSANDFLNSLGVTLGWQLSNAQYTTMINYIGVRNLRGCRLIDNGNNISVCTSLALATNTKILWMLDSGWNYGTLNADISGAEQLAKAGVLLAVEGANEPDAWPVTYQGVVGGGGAEKGISWLPVAKLQRDLYAAVKADTLLQNYPVFDITHNGNETDNVGLQFLTIPPGSNISMPDGTKYADYANVHNYVVCQGCTNYIDNQAWDNANPAQKLGNSTEPMVDDYGVTWHKQYQGYTSAQLPSVPRVTTETGWWVPNSSVEDLGGKIILDTYLSQFKRGYKYTFIYQLIDEDDSFGLYYTNGTAKREATYIHNLTTILNDNVSVSTTPGALNYSIPNEPATVHDLLLQKSTGAFELVVWDERPVGEATDNVNVTLGATFTTVNLYDPTIGTTATKTLANVSSVSLTLTDHPIIIEVVK